MKLTAQVKLNPSHYQHQLLKATLERANSACNYVSEYAFAHGVFNAYALQRALYPAIRTQFGLAAQLVVRCLGKVADAYKVNQERRCVFREHGAIPYDNRILSWETVNRRVSIWVLPGRETIAYQCGERQAELLKYQQGETDLVHHCGEWYLLTTCEVPEETPPSEIDGYLGIDKGVINVAVDSDGNIYQGQRIECTRRYYARPRRELQQVGTKSAKKRLKKLSGRQARFQKDCNHCILKELVLRAARTKRGIAQEDLTGINLRTRVRREDRAERGNWSFNQLDGFIAYKARLYGVPHKRVDPAYTSQRCSCCGHVDKTNRRSQAEFLCARCGFSIHADVNAAANVASKAAVMQPMVSDAASAG